MIDLDSIKRLTRTQMAARVAQDIPEGWYVNVGIGLPILVPDQTDPELEIFFQAENGVLGVGPVPAPEEQDLWLINAAKQYVSLRPGGCFFHHADSFAMIRGGHLDLCLLGAYQVAANGDIANWTTGAEGAIPGVGGAMDLALGAQNVWVMMEQFTREGESRLVETCTYPLTARGAVRRIYTDLAVLDVTPDGLVVREIVADLSFDALQDITPAKLLPRD